MSLKEWAINEVKIACKRENPDIELDENGMPKEFDYGCSCYGSALKAFNSLVDDEHSGFSIMLTKQILNRLIDGKCLTPIEDTDGIWNFSHKEEGKYTSCQCRRMSSFFKRVYNDGRVEYHDNDRVSCIDTNGNAWHSAGASNLVDKMFPIELPYYPAEKPYKVYREDFLVDPKNGDFDTWAYLYLITPDGERIELNQYWCEKNGEVVEIDKEEFEERKAHRVKGGNGND